MYSKFEKYFFIDSAEMKFSKMLKYGSIFVVTMMVCFWGGICVGGLLKGISLQELFAEKGTKMVEYAGIMLVDVVLIFRNLYGKSHWAAYLVSMLAFALIHILGYAGQYTPLEIFLAVLQYLPAGLCLAWSYTKADTIFAPIAIHATVNFITLTSWR